MSNNKIIRAQKSLKLPKISIKKCVIPWEMFSKKWSWYCHFVLLSAELCFNSFNQEEAYVSFQTFREIFKAHLAQIFQNCNSKFTLKLYNDGVSQSEASISCRNNILSSINR